MMSCFQKNFDYIKFVLDGCTSSRLRSVQVKGKQNLVLCTRPSLKKENVSVIKFIGKLRSSYSDYGFKYNAYGDLYVEYSALT